MAQVNSADSSISQLMEQAEQEKAAAEAAAAQEEAEETSDDNSDDNSDVSEETEEPDYSEETNDVSDDNAEDSETTEDNDYTEDTSSGSEASEDTDSSSDTSSSDSSSSSQGTYLGNFKLTGYCNCAQCCGTAGNATASGVMPTAGHTVAMAGVPFGTKLLINGTVYTVEDLGTPYGHVDIYCSSHSEALSFGLQYADVYQLN